MASEFADKEIERIRKRTLKFLPVAISVVIIVVFVYSLLMGVNLKKIASIGLKDLLLVFFLLIFLPIIAGIRLSLIARSIGINAKHDGILARGASQFIALTTPATAGAQIVKAFWIKIKGGGWDLGFGVAYLETFFDVLLVNSIILTLEIPAAIRGDIKVLPVIILSLYSVVLFILLFTAAIVEKSRTAIVKLLRKMRIPIEEENIKNFGIAFQSIIKQPFNLLIVILLTISYLIVQGGVALIVSLSLGENMSLIDAIIFAAMVQVMGGTPTPGGSIGVEYGATLLLEPQIVVTWRLISYFGTLVYTFILFELFIIHYVRRRSTLAIRTNIKVNDSSMQGDITQIIVKSLNLPKM